MPPPPSTRILHYRGDTPTAVRWTAARWLRIAAVINALAAAASLAFLAGQFPRGAPVALSTLKPWLSNNLLILLPLTIFLAGALLCPFLAPVVFRARKLACYLAILLTSLLQLLSFLLLCFFAVVSTGPWLAHTSLWYALYLIPALLALAYLAFLTDLSALLQWIPRYPDLETTLDRFLPGPPCL
ncbi:MAG TPA: hypothetical protein VH253_10730 [Phycisphaerae bacterium]|nr:hypothetical protein [Phycisphaerae bacterium]